MELHPTTQGLRTMRLLIDGYNLCHALGFLGRTGPRGKPGPHELEKARKQLVGLVAGFGPNVGATVVFDAAGSPPLASGEDWQQGIHLRFAMHGSADDLIEELIAADSDPQRLAVVSDDRRIQKAARQRHCPAWSTEQFEKELAGAQRQKAEPTKLPPEKPEAISEKETQEWLAKFSEEKPRKRK